jgi:HSP20 family protein
MAITRWDPMNELQALTRRMEHVFETFGTPRFMDRGIASAGGLLESVPVVDVYEDKEEIIFRAEVPGMEQKDVEVVMEDNALTLRGTRKLQREDKRENYIRIEAEYGAFSRSFPLPSTVDRDKIRAEMKNGVLEIHVPKREGAKGKTIPVHT